MSKGYKISDSLRIRDQRIFHGEKQLFFSEKPGQEFLKEAYKFLEIAYPKFHKMDALCKLGILATEILFRNNEISADTALVFSNSTSSLETDKQHRILMETTVSPAVFVYTLPNIVLGEISIRHKLQSENAFFISNRFDAGLLKDYSEILLDSLKTSAVVCGWIEWKNAEYDVFLCLISRNGEVPFSVEKLEELYHFENE
ncbi:hypothetical protein ACKGJN_09500 [Gillisia sp. Q332]|uniref:hypothetical protein n=1 Tax=Gillisia xinjiangensis TaxID=3384765 RepID=UPI003918B786